VITLHNSSSIAQALSLQALLCCYRRSVFAGLNPVQQEFGLPGITDVTDPCTLLPTHVATNRCCKNSCHCLCWLPSPVAAAVPALDVCVCA